MLLHRTITIVLAFVAALCPALGGHACGVGCEAVTAEAGHHRVSQTHDYEQVAKVSVARTCEARCVGSSCSTDTSDLPIRHDHGGKHQDCICQGAAVADFGRGYADGLIDLDAFLAPTFAPLAAALSRQALAPLATGRPGDDPCPPAWGKDLCAHFCTRLI
ncbi:hypothetical protein Mal64_01730 [Pseudobythopirellula maris]|uniref:Uncharacterized protein n=1 Tax=Pseudobythopirellula maris TaxID=2527991 RepID=A0A5C5ZQI7_9BACT|nr:hypothetical protein [Pseudobythopirellula maris]TWT89794.1 hypothetical protein Mal64_01730 [Pseudobythopirellula maris]